MPAGMLFAEGVYLGGMRLVFWKNKASGAPQRLEEVSGCSPLLQCGFAAFQRWDDGPKVARASASTLPIWLPGGFNLGAQPSWHPEIFLLISCFFSPHCWSLLCGKRPSKPLFESRVIFWH